MTSPDAIIFDLDGTLLHSAPDLHAAANAMLRHLGRPEQDLATTISFIGNGVEILVQRCLAASGGASADIHNSALACFRDSYAANLTTLTRPYDGVVALLDALQAAGIPMAICTNKPQDPARQICDDLGLSGYFVQITGAQDGIPKKPDPSMVRSCMDALGTAPERTLYVGDSLVDHQSAINAGLAFRLFDGGYLKGEPQGLDPSHRFSDWHQFRRALLPSTEDIPDTKE